ncbi:MAG: GTPase [Fervidicoccaceae archaeon]
MSSEIDLAKWRELREKLAASDVVLVLVEARNPLGTFSERLWREVEEAGKKAVLLLNKSDLVPPRIAIEWSSYLESKLNSPTLPISATKRLGTLRLRKLLRRLLRESGREKLYCLVAGVPKVGKSSVINVLKGRSSAPTSLYPGSPGYTKSYTFYRVESRIYILDAPGVVPDVPDPLERLLRLHKPEKLPDPVGAAVAVLERVARGFKKDLEAKYRAPYVEPYSFLSELARRRGWLEKKTGEPLIEQAALVVVRDYLGGEIKFYVEPPIRAREPRD